MLSHRKTVVFFRYRGSCRKILKGGGGGGQQKQHFGGGGAYSEQYFILKGWNSQVGEIRP